MLRLSSFKVPPGHHAVLAEYLCNSECRLRSLALPANGQASLIASLHHNTTLTSLTLWNLDKAAVTTLALILPYNHTLRKLDLSIEPPSQSVLQQCLEKLQVHSENVMHKLLKQCGEQLRVLCQAWSRVILEVQLRDVNPYF